MTPLEKYITSVMHYDPDTGIFRWKDHRKRKKPTAGSLGKDGYLRIMINYQMYSAGPLAWFLYYGEWPKNIIDHIDRNPSNNRISNLRLSNHSDNGFNSDIWINNTTGYKGVQQEKRTGRWYARLGSKYIGTFSSFEEAVNARKEAERAYTNT